MQCVGARRVPHQPMMMNRQEALSTIKKKCFYKRKRKKEEKGPINNRDISIPLATTIQPSWVREYDVSAPYRTVEKIQPDLIVYTNDID